MIYINKHFLKKIVNKNVLIIGNGKYPTKLISFVKNKTNNYHILWDICPKNKANWIQGTELVPENLFEEMQKYKKQIFVNLNNNIKNKSLKSIINIIENDIFIKAFHGMLFDLIIFKNALKKIKPDIVINTFASSIFNDNLKNICYHENIELVSVNKKLYFDKFLLPFKKYYYIIGTFLYIISFTIFNIQKYKNKTILYNFDKNKKYILLICFNKHGFEQTLSYIIKDLKKVSTIKFIIFVMDTFSRLGTSEQIIKNSFSDKIHIIYAKQLYFNITLPKLFNYLYKSIKILYALRKSTNIFIGKTKGWYIGLSMCPFLTYLYTDLSKVLYKCIPKIDSVFFSTANATRPSALADFFDKKNIKNYHVQHGFIGEIFRLVSKVNTFLAWSEYDRLMFLKYGGDKNVIGNFYHLTKLNKKPELKLKNKPVHILILTSWFSKSSFWLTKDRFLQDNKNFIESVLYAIHKVDRNIKIFIRPHPRQKKMDFNNIFSFFDEIENIEILNYSNSTEHIEKVDIVFTWFSSCILEAALLLKPCFVFDTPDISRESPISLIDSNRLFKNGKELELKLKKLYNNQGLLDYISPEKNFLRKYFGTTDFEANDFTSLLNKSTSL